MYFMNGASSPFYKIDYKEKTIRGQLEIDTSKEIRSVSMGLRGGLTYTGITFYDEDSVIISSYIWSIDEYARETPKYQIPAD